MEALRQAIQRALEEGDLLPGQELQDLLGRDSGRTSSQDAGDDRPVDGPPDGGKATSRASRK